MLEPGVFLEKLKAAGFDFYVGVPCSFFDSLIDSLFDDPEVEVTMAVNEGAAVGIAAGASLAGRNPVVFLQNSGVGNMMNPLTSLALPYKIPCLILCSGRAFEIPDEPQHTVMGSIMVPFFELLSIPCEILQKELSAATAQIQNAKKAMKDRGCPAVLIVRKGTFAKDEGIRRPPMSVSENVLVSRHELVEQLFKKIRPNDAVIVSTGYPSRDVYAIADRPRNFYVMGSMGHTSAIALGYASCHLDACVYLIEGDGSALMHMGTMSTIGAKLPSNLIHIVLDNECHDSTGGQATSSSTTNFRNVALACGYKASHDVPDREALSRLLRNWEGAISTRPAFIHVKVNRQKARKRPRITEKYAPTDITRNFMAK